MILRSYRTQSQDLTISTIGLFLSMTCMIALLGPLSSRPDFTTDLLEYGDFEEPEEDLVVENDQ